MNSKPGEFASEFIRASLYPALLVEVNYAAGFAHNAELQKRVFTTVIAEILDKPKGTQFIAKELAIGQGTGLEPNHAYTIDEVKALEEKHRQRYKNPEDGTAVIHILVLNGHYSTDTALQKTLALAYRGSSVVLFQETLNSACNPQKPQLCDLTGSTILVHELGHLFGLVNMGTKMQKPHEDSAHSHHDPNSDCIMYWAHDALTPADIERAQRDKPDSGSAYLFDQACLDDLKAVRLQ